MLINASRMVNQSTQKNLDIVIINIIAFIARNN